MHLIILPVTYVFPKIGPDVRAIAVDLVPTELSIVFGAVFPEELAVTLFLPVNIIPNVLGLIFPYFCSFPRLFVMKPVPFVPSSIEMLIDALAMSFIV